MAIEITGKFKPKNGKTFAIVDAADVEMPDGSRLSDFKGGVSPTVTVTAITGGHRVTITDAAGTKTFDVMDGEDGEGGSGASITVDTTLTKAGQAADAKAVGDAISSMNHIYATDDGNGIITLSYSPLTPASEGVF